MNSTDLTREQIEEIGRVLGLTQGYLCRLIKRMEQRRFPHDDTVYLDAMKAQTALQALNMRLHYLCCSGVGEPRRVQIDG